MTPLGHQVVLGLQGRGAGLGNIQLYFDTINFFVTRNQGLRHLTVHIQSAVAWRMAGWGEADL